MTEQKRNVPISDLDMQMQMIEPAYGKIFDQLKTDLNTFKVSLEDGSIIEVIALNDLRRAFGSIDFISRDIRLSNLSRIDGEYHYIGYYFDLASDLLQSGMIKPFFTCHNRIAKVNETSQGRGGFLRRILNTLRSENSYTGLEPKKSNLFNKSKNNGGGFQ